MHAMISVGMVERLVMMAVVEGEQSAQHYVMVDAK